MVVMVPRIILQILSKIMYPVKSKLQYPPPPLPGIPRAFDCAGGEFEPDLSLHSQDTISPLLANNSFKRIFKRSLKMP